MIPTTSAPVVPPAKSQVQNALAVGIARAVAKVGGAGTLADRIGTSVATITRTTAATHLPELHTAFAATMADPTALDEVADLYGVRVVPAGSVCTSDTLRLSATLCTLLSKAIDAEMDGRVDHVELLGMERELRDARAMIDRKLARIGEIRGLRAVV
jgi:hypothetical protein